MLTVPTIPARMTAVEIREAGAPDVLVPCTRPVPRPSAGEVLIRVAAAGVNRPDCLQRRGSYPPPPGASDLPGLEVAGTVAAIGDNVRTPAVGDEICALLAGGGYAEYCTTPAVQCLPIPSGLDQVQAAALPETFFTVWTNVFERGQLAAGECILIHGGASGIGTTAIQLAKCFGARVFTTVSTTEKVTFCESLGAERAINYRQEKFTDVIDDLTDGRGVDVILDIVGASYFLDNLSALALDGRLVIIATLGGNRAELNLTQLLTRRLTVTASTLRPRAAEEKGRIAQGLLDNVWPRLSAGDVAPVIQETFPLVDAWRAHEIMEANLTMGKLVLTL